MSIPSAIGGYGDWPAFVRSSTGFEAASPGASLLASVLGVPAPAAQVPAVETVEETVVDDVSVTRLAWQLPYGPPTTGYLLAPAGATGPLPGVLWLHCHAGNKFQGAERLIDLGAGTTPGVRRLQADLYSGRALANDLARAGFAVLVHDAFSWGTRRFTLDPAPPRTHDAVLARKAQWERDGVQPTAEALYNAAAADHENTLAKAAGLLGTTYSGMVAYEDLTALAVLRSLPQVDSSRLGTGGFSGGGGRALILSALAADIASCVVTCMMTTFESLFPAYLDRHSWLLNSPNLATAYEWPELAAVAPGTRFLVQYALDDALFPREGMRAADAMLSSLLPDGNRYRGRWYDAGHVFTEEIRADAVAHLQATLGVAVPLPEQRTESAF